MKKEAIEPLTELKTETEMVFWNTIYQRETTGRIMDKEKGFVFAFNKIVGDTEVGIEAEYKEYLLSTEEKLDEEDVLNVNEIMFGNNLSFIEYKED